MNDETPANRPQSPKVEPTPLPTEAELSRIARQAVHQPPDARLDRQLARMGLIEAADPVEPQLSQPASGPVSIDPEVMQLREELRRTRSIVWLLVGVVAILAVVIVVLLVR